MLLWLCYPVESVFNREEELPFSFLFNFSPSIYMPVRMGGNMEKEIFYAVQCSNN